MNLPHRSKIFSGIFGALLLLSDNLSIDIVSQTTSYKSEIMDPSFFVLLRREPRK